MKEKYNVTGMTCSACSSRVEKAVGKMPEINAVTVNLLTNSMVVEYDDGKLTPDAIIKTVVDAGYGASLAEANGSQAKKSSANAPKVNPAEEQMKDFKIRLIVSFAFLIPLMYVSMGHMIGLPLPSFLAGHENAVSFAFAKETAFCFPRRKVLRFLRIGKISDVPFQPGFQSQTAFFGHRKGRVPLHRAFFVAEGPMPILRMNAAFFKVHFLGCCHDHSRNCQEPKRAPGTGEFIAHGKGMKGR